MKAVKKFAAAFMLFAILLTSVGAMQAFAQESVIEMTTDNFYWKAGRHLNGTPTIDNENNRTTDCRNYEYLLTKNPVNMDNIGSVSIPIRYDYGSDGSVVFGISFVAEPQLVAETDPAYTTYNQFVESEPLVTVTKTKTDLSEGSEVAIDVSGLGLSGEGYLQISAVNQGQWVPCLGDISLIEKTQKTIAFNTYDYAIGGQVNIQENEIDSVRYTPTLCFKDIDMTDIVAMTIYGGSSGATVEVYADMTEHITSDGYDDEANRYYSGTTSGGTLIGSFSINTGGYSIYEENTFTLTNPIDGVCDLYFVFRSSGWAGNYRTFTLHGSDEALENSTPLRFNNAYADNMVIQRNDSFVIKGYSKPDLDITVTVSGTDKDGETVLTTRDVRSAAADQSSPLKPALWSAEFDALPAGGTYTVTAQTEDETVEIENVTFGDVFLLAGQSNMERRMVEMGDTKAALDGGEEDERADNPDIRVFSMYKIDTAGSGVALEEPSVNSWSVMNKDVAYDTSAIGYYVAQSITEEQGVPVGLISAAVGGTKLELWAEGGGLYNNRVYPFRDMRVSGVLYYQGEADADPQPGASPVEYGYAMAKLIDNYRELWNDEELPFYYVQLMRIERWNNRAQDFKDIREGQTLALDMAANQNNLHLIPTLDLNGSYNMFEPGIYEGSNHWAGNARDDIHPQGKEIVAERIYNCIENDLYGGTGAVSGPRYRSMSADGDRLILSYETTGDLKILPKEAYADYYTDTYIAETGADADSVCEFEIAGADGVYYAADAELDGANVILSSENVAEPIAFRYAYDSYPEIPNLTDDSGLPTTAVSDSLATKSVVCIGDSITAGFGISNSSAYYPSVLQNYLSEGELSGYTVYNEGVSGRCVVNDGYAPYVDEDEFEEALKINGDIYVVMLGTNDAQYRNYAYIDDFAADYKRIIRSIRAFNPDAKIYLATPIPVIEEYDDSNSGNINGQYIGEIVETVKDICAEEECTPIDTNALFQGEELYQSDGIHPNQNGAARLAEIVYSHISASEEPEPEPEPDYETDTLAITRDESSDKLSFNVKNKSDAAQPVVLIAASYKDGALIAFSVSEEKTIAAQAAENLQTDMPVGDDYKIFLWTSLDSCIPYNVDVRL